MDPFPYCSKDNLQAYRFHPWQWSTAPGRANLSRFFEVPAGSEIDVSGLEEGSCTCVFLFHCLYLVFA